MIERYDRSPHAPQGRIHQEDFNQVLGASGNQKYQKYGGKVSLERIARVFSATAGIAIRWSGCSSWSCSPQPWETSTCTRRTSPCSTFPSGSIDAQPRLRRRAAGPPAQRRRSRPRGRRRVPSRRHHHPPPRSRRTCVGTGRGRRACRGNTHIVLQLASTETPRKRAHAGLARQMAYFIRY